MFAQADGINCKKIEIESCEIANPNLVNGNFVCSLCRKTFYKSSDGKCIAVPKKIDFCAYYSSDTECLECLKGYVLTKDKKSCTNNLALK